MTCRDDERWMGVALEEADRAAAAGEVPVGAVVVVAGRPVGRSCACGLQRGCSAAEVGGGRRGQERARRRRAGGGL
jgi:tRNA(adenine34) deaminase